MHLLHSARNMTEDQAKYLEDFYASPFGQRVIAEYQRQISEYEKNRNSLASLHAIGGGYYQSERNQDVHDLKKEMGELKNMIMGMVNKGGGGQPPSNPIPSGGGSPSPTPPPKY